MAPLPSQVADKLGQKVISLQFCGSVSLGDPHGVRAGLCSFCRSRGNPCPGKAQNRSPTRLLLLASHPSAPRSGHPCIHWAHLDGPGRSSHLKLRNHTCQSLLSGNRTPGAGIKRWTWGPLPVSHSPHVGVSWLSLATSRLFSTPGPLSSFLDDFSFWASTFFFLFLFASLLS